MPKDDIDFTEVTKAVAEVKTSFEEFKSTNDDRVKLLIKGITDPLIEEKLKKINDDLKEKQDIIDRVYAATKRTMLTVDGQQVDLADMDEKALSWAQIAAKARGTTINEYSAQNLKEYSTAFKQFMRKDERLMSGDETKALSVGSDPDGGYLVSPDTSGRIIKKQFETSPIRQFASVQVISSDALEGLFDLDEAGFGWVAEKGARNETSTPQLDAWRIPVHEVYAEPRATQRLIDDAAIDIEAWLAGKVADRFSRVENAAFVNGDGAGKPRGFLSYAGGTSGLGQIERFKTGVNGGFAATPNGADVLINTVYGLKEAYRARAIFAANRLTQGAMRLLKNNDGDYIWQPSIQVGQPSTLLGYPVVGFEDMPNFSTTGALGIAFGDFAEGYQIVDRLGIRVLRDPYTAKPYVKYYTTKRVGGDVLNFEALKLVEFAA
jgi:HK97 family phage major capsid protein